MIMEKIAELFIILILVSVVLNVSSPFIKFAIKLYSFQSLMLAFYILMGAVHFNSINLYGSFVITVIFKVILIPYFLFKTLKKVKMDKEIDMYIGIPEAVVFAGSLTLLSNLIAQKIVTAGITFGAFVFTISLATFLIGAMLMITRKTLFSQIIGFLTIDNAIFLAANSITHGMPLLVELGVLFDLFVSILILSILILNLKRNAAV